MISGYVRNGGVDKALELFQQIHERDSVSWLSMVAGYAQNGYSENTLNIFKKMQLEGVGLFSNMCINVIIASHGNMAYMD